MQASRSALENSKPFFSGSHSLPNASFKLKILSAASRIEHRSLIRCEVVARGEPCLAGEAVAESVEGGLAFALSGDRAWWSGGRCDG
jgi:hypothetical protein